MTSSNAEIDILVSLRDQATAALNKLNGEINRLGIESETADKKSRGLGGALDSVGKIAAGNLIAKYAADAATGVKNFFDESINAASDLGESLNAVNKIFGDSSSTILDWGKSNANSFGLSQRTFNQMAVPLGAVLRNAGLSMDVVADSTTALTERAADMASVFNTDVSEALAAIQSGLRGEANPLERFGVGLNAAAVEARALADSGKTSAKSLTDQEKALARLAIIFDQTASTAGDFRDTSDQLANSQRIAAARSEELQAKLGQFLLPITLAVTSAKLKLVNLLIDKVVPAFSSFIKYIQFTWKEGDALNDFLGSLPGFMQPVVEIIGKLLLAFKPLIEAIVGNKELLTAGLVGLGTVAAVAFTAWAVAAGAAAVATLAAAAPVIALGLVIAALGAGIYLLIKNWDDITAKYPIVGKATEVLRDVFVTAWRIISDVVTAAAGIITSNIHRLEPIFSFMQDFVKAKLDGVKMIFSSLVEIITSVVNLVSDIVHGRWSQAWQELKDIAGAAVELFIGTLKFHFGNIPGIILGFAGDILSATYKLLGNVVQAGIDYAKHWYELGRDIVYGVWDGIKSLGNWFKNQVEDFFGGIVDGAKSKLGIGSPSRVFAEIGRDIVRGLNQGLDSVAVQPSLGIGASSLGLSSISPSSLTGSGTTNNYYIAGSVLSERELFRLIRDKQRGGGLLD